jgi:putative heme-binding domain-containing protein
MGIRQRYLIGAIVAVVASGTTVLNLGPKISTDLSAAAFAEDGATSGNRPGADIAAVTKTEPSLTGNVPASADSHDDQTLAEGRALFRGLCSGCHGGNARGGKGPDLTDNRWLHGSTDANIAHVIANGVSGTTMKKLGESLKDEQIANIIAYIRSLAHSPGETDWKPYLVGDAAAGDRLFFDTQSQLACNKCHALGGRGGGIGPPMDRIVSRRSPEYIMESIVHPSKDIDPRYEVMLVITNRGTTVTGIRVNESNFSIQLREQDGRFHSFSKRDLDEVQTLKTSLMPDNLVDSLTVRQLHDLFAFLMTME